MFSRGQKQNQKQPKPPSAQEILKHVLPGEAVQTQQIQPPAAKARFGKRFTVMYGAVLVLFLFLYAASSALVVYPNPGAESTRITLYFVNPAQNSLSPETRFIPVPATRTELISAALTEFVKGPLTSGHTRVIPREPAVIEQARYVQGERLCLINVSGEYHNLSLRDQLFARAAVALTLTSFDFIDRVAFHDADGELLSTQGVPLGELLSENIALNPQLSPARTNTRRVTLYFANDTGERLIPEARTVEVAGSIEHTIVEQLIRGPTGGASQVLLSDITVKSATTTDGICYVDFGPGFLSRQITGTNADIIAVYSIVNSLTELQGVQMVQIISDSMTITDSAAIDLSIPLARDESYIR